MQKSQRLIHLIMLINAKRAFTVPELAREFGLSHRTIARDLLELSELGVPIYSVQGRGGGYRLLRERMLPPIAFTESEAVAMFFACQSLQYFGSLPFGDGAEAALRKFYHYLPSDAKERIDRLKDKVVIWNPYRSMSATVLQTLLQAVMAHSAVTIEYRSGRGLTRRDIQPIGLYAAQGYWYCPAYCFERGGYRLFRADRVASAELNGTIACLEEVDSKSVLDWDAHETAGSPIMTVTATLTPEGVRTVDTSGWPGLSIERHEDGGGLAHIETNAGKLAFLVDMIWGLGENAVITGPEEAVRMIKQKAERVLNRYA